MAEGIQIELPFRVEKLGEVHGGQVAGRVVQEHVFGTGIRRVDPPVFRTGMPFVDRRIVLCAGIGANPSGPGNLVPEVAGLDRPADLAVDPAAQFPIAIPLQGIEEAVRDTHAVVGILPRHGLVGLAVPIGVIFVKHKVGVALLRVVEHAMDIGFRHHVATGGGHGFPQHLVVFHIQREVPQSLRID